MTTQVERVRRIGNMGRLAFSRYLDLLVEIRQASRQRWPAERLEVLAELMDKLESQTLEHEAQAEAEAMMEDEG